jgi:hypothetical protein
MTLPPAAREKVDAKELYVLPPRGRRGRDTDDSTEQFVDATRMGTVA